MKKRQVESRLLYLDRFVLNNKSCFCDFGKLKTNSFEKKFVVRNIFSKYVDCLASCDHILLPNIFEDEILLKMFRDTVIHFYSDSEYLQIIQSLKENYNVFAVRDGYIGEGILFLLRIYASFDDGKIITEEISPFQRRNWISCSFDNIDYSQIIKCIDEGYASVYLIDKNDQYRGMMTRKTLKFLFYFRLKELSDIKLFSMNSFIQYDESLELMKKQAIKLFKNPLIEEIPVIENGKLIFSFIRNRHVVTYLERLNFYKLDWQIIPDEILRSYLQEGNIYISSECSNLMGGKEKIQNATRAKIKILSPGVTLNGRTRNYFLYMNEHALEKYMGQYMLPLDMHKVYTELLIRTVVQVLMDNGIHLFFFDIKGKPPKERLNQIKKFTSYVKGISKCTLPGNLSVMRAMDCDTENMHVVGGERLTIGNPSSSVNTIYFFGPCTVLGDWSKDSETIETYLQEYINQEDVPYRVINKGTGGTPPINALYLLISTKLKAGDTVILFLNSNLLPKDSAIFGDNYYKVEDVFNLPENVSLKPFMNLECWAHFDETGNQAVAKFIYDKVIKEIVIEKNVDKIRKEIGTPLSFLNVAQTVNSDMERGLKDYLSVLSDCRVSAENVGAIVMNCNPFTKGHYYLVDYARKNVDYLYVFVVEEDKSMFSFDDRFECARLNCKGFSNVKVIPSGKYIISNLTFAAYFNKENLQDTTVYPVLDVRIFGQFVAPYFHIMKRFVGEEPFDKVTRQYNEAMKKILSGEYGIEVIEIPRFSYYGDCVSATKVRNYIRCKDWKSCKNYVTDTTYKYLMMLESKGRL